MNAGLLVMWGLSGYCGNEPRRWPPKPQPDPWWWIVIDFVGGVIGGLAYSTIFPQGTAELGLYAATSSVGALVGSVVLHSLVERVLRGGQGARN
ncbi:MAG TPA: hypothetical protein VE078_13610 [Thermoanaerobaculia bacterium]|nr:hypothetical protein [Thermoanaerobaculia bacterium]